MSLSPISMLDSVRENIFRMSTLLKLGQILLLIIILSLAQGTSSFPGFGGAVDKNVTKEVLKNGTVMFTTVHYVEDKHAYFYGAGICTYYMVNCCILVLCYFMDHRVTQSSAYEVLLSTLGSIFFLSLGMRTFIFSSISQGKAKLITEGCCCIGVAVLQIIDAIFTFRRLRKEH